MHIVVVIVTYNAEKWIQSCFESLRNNTINFNTIVIDNNSTDGTISALTRNYPEVELIRSSTNLGFGAANNIGIRKAYESGADFVFLLNQDAYVEKNTIQKLCELQSLNQEYGIISPIHLAENGNVVDKTFLSYISDKNNNSMISDIITHDFLKTLYSFPFINAAIWNISRKCIEEVGIFDEIFSHYGEDTDYCNRVLSNNLKIGVAPSIKAVHNRSQDPSRSPLSFKNRLFINYLLYFKNKNEPFSNLLVNHIMHSFKSMLLALIKLNFKVLYNIISVNCKLIKVRKKIIYSRREQLRKLAFMHLAR